MNIVSKSLPFGRTAFKAVEGDAVIGSCYITGGHNQFDMDVWLWALEVKPEKRKQGIATELINKARESVPKKKVFLHCVDELIPFYRKRGFRRMAHRSHAGHNVMVIEEKEL